MQQSFELAVKCQNDPKFEVEEKLPVVHKEHVAELVILPHDEPDVAVMVDMDALQLAQFQEEQCTDIEVVLPELTNAVVEVEEPTFERATVLEVSVRTGPRPAPMITKKYSMRVQRLQEILGPNCLYCVCDQCAFKFILTSKFSSVLSDAIFCDPQADDGEIVNALPPPNLKNKQINKLVNMVRTVRTAADRHQEKMYVLCKKGKVS